VVAVGRWQTRGKEQLVLIRPYQDGLILHQLFYATEVRAFDDIDLGATFEFKEVELDLADKLIDQLKIDAFDAESFADSYTDRVRGLIDQKVAGQEITVAAEQPRAQIIDLFEALKQSLDKPGGKQAAKKKGAKAKDADVEPRPVKKASPRKGGRAKKTSTG
jgi:DNA end-binding protein Ku